MASEEQVGNIVYQVQMDVANLIEAQRKVNERLEKMSGGASKAASKFDQLQTSISKVAGAIAASIVVDWGKQFLQVADSMAQLQARITRLSTDAVTARETFSSLADIASKTGASLSDTTKLWETLTSSLKEAGATNAQVLNLTDTLQKIGRIGGSSSEEMANALRQFGQSIASGTIRAEEFNSILEQMPELARQIATGLGMSMGELRQEMLAGKLTAQDALNAIQDRTMAVNAEFNKLPRSLGQATGALETSFAKLVVAINDATGASSGAVQIIDKLAGYIDLLGDKSTSAADKLWSLAEVVSKLNPGVIGSTLADLIMDDGDEKKLAEYNAQVERFTKASSAGYEAAKKQAEGIKHVTIASSAAASSKTKKGAKPGKSSQEREAESISEKLEQLRQKAMLAATSTQELSRSQSILNAQQSLGKGATEEQIKLAGDYAAQAYDVAAALRAQQTAEKKRQDTEKSYQQTKNQSSPMASADDQFNQQMASLNAYAALYPQKIAEVESTRAAIEKQYRDQRMTLMWQEWSEQNAATMAAAAAFDSLGSTASNALTGILTGSMSVNDAMRSIGMTVLNSVVNTFVQMGVEWVKSAITGSSAQIAATAATTSAAVAGTATTTAASVSSAAATTAAWTPAAIVASIGSFGGAAAIGIGAVIAAMALSSSLAGKRKNGGPVSAGGMYQVGEGGMPEIYQANNGSQYMIPGDNGKVISNKDMQGSGGGGVVVNINNYTSSSVDAQATPDGNGGWSVEAFIYDLDNGGQASQAILRNHQAPRKARE